MNFMGPHTETVFSKNVDCMQFLQLANGRDGATFVLHIHKPWRVVALRQKLPLYAIKTRCQLRSCTWNIWCTDGVRI